MSLAQNLFWQKTGFKTHKIIRHLQQENFKNNMSIQNCVQEDLEGIYKLYAEARKLQATHNVVVWPHFDKSLIVKEIENLQQWKILINGEMACNWATTFVDKDIWEEKDQGDGIYIHRLATNPAFRGNSLVSEMVSWAKAYAKEIIENMYV
jgi:ribosomal protein S18 acetylase RimI-like enzyme